MTDATHPTTKEPTPTDAAATATAGPAPVGNGPAESAAEVERLRQLLSDTEQKLAAVEQELANFKLRLADMENYRKRLLRNVEEEKKYAAEPLVRDLLGAFDNLERALAAARSAGDNGPLAVGVAATAAQFLDILRRHGVTRIDCGPGTPFDPNLHQAVAQETTAAVPPGHVAKVLQQGFYFHDRVLRPTHVVVAAAPAEPPAEQSAPSSDSSDTPSADAATGNP